MREHFARHVLCSSTVTNCQLATVSVAGRREPQIRRTACQNVQLLASARLGKMAILLTQNLHFQPYRRPEGGPSLLSPSSPSRKSTFSGPSILPSQKQSSKFFGAPFCLVKAKNFDCALGNPWRLGLRSIPTLISLLLNFVRFHFHYLPKPCAVSSFSCGTIPASHKFTYVFCQKF